MIRTRQKRTLAMLLVLTLALALAVPAAAEVSEQTLSAAVTDMAEYILKTVRSPQVGSTGGEWAVLHDKKYTIPVQQLPDGGWSLTGTGSSDALGG